MIRKGLAFGFISALAMACGGAQPATQAPSTVAVADAGAQAIAPAPAPADPTSGNETAPVPITATDPSWGSKTALVTIVEFSDFQCPFCSRVEGTLQQIRSDYGPDKLRIVWKNEPLPFHPNAKP